MRAAIYLRVSTGRCRRCRRGEHGPDARCPAFEPEQSEANQEPECGQLCRARGWEPVFFRERESGAKARPEWRRLLEAARRGQVGAVVFWALDRVGRDQVQVCHDLRELARWNVHIASVRDAWVDQPPGPFRDLMLQIVAWFAEGERRRLIERTKAGQARARLLGKTIGRPPLPAGALARALAAARSGVPIARAAREAGIGRRTLRDALAENGADDAPGKVAS